MKGSRRGLVSTPQMFSCEGLGVSVRADHPVVRRVGQISEFSTVLSTIISSELQ